MKQEQKSKKGHRSLEPSNAEVVLQNRLDNWSKIIEDMSVILEDVEEFEEPYSKLWLRYSWACLWLSQVQPNLKTDETASQLSDMSRLAQKFKVDVLLVNYDNIPRLNKEDIDLQISKMKILSTFTSSANSHELLENILLKKGDPDEESEGVATTIYQFINDSSSDMKLRLWAILFDHYDANKVSDSYQYGFEAIVSLMVHDLQSSDFNNLSGSKKTHV
ncbi:unnamed protein product [Ambrosiozyma monospora]|uniref:Unnamed protein product n=1 Tax=Ambrosiozyma monospora TaxID=43982 RepID=A0ACB5UBW2_AMBMO|nr:unnamed protein product [Ambrosiozyma monospora]